MITLSVHQFCFELHYHWRNGAYIAASHTIVNYKGHIITNRVSQICPKSSEG